VVIHSFGIEPKLHDSLPKRTTPNGIKPFAPIADRGVRL